MLGLNKTVYNLNHEINLNKEKEPWVYGIEPSGARVIAEDNRKSPVLLMNDYGKGYAFLFASPTLSIMPPVGRNGLVEDTIATMARYKGLPVSISPPGENVEFLISKTGSDKAIIFVMNHGPGDWDGDVTIDFLQAGLSRHIGRTITAKVFRGYGSTEVIEPLLEKPENKLIIKGLSIEGDTGDSYAYRQANFILVNIE